MFKEAKTLRFPRIGRHVISKFKKKPEETAKQCSFREKSTGILKEWTLELTKGKGHATVDVFKQDNGIGWERT